MIQSCHDRANNIHLMNWMNSAWIMLFAANQSEFNSNGTSILNGIRKVATCTAKSRCNAQVPDNCMSCCEKENCVPSLYALDADDQKCQDKKDKNSTAYSSILASCSNLYWDWLLGQLNIDTNRTKGLNDGLLITKSLQSFTWYFKSGQHGKISSSNVIEG